MLNVAGTETGTEEADDWAAFTDDWTPLKQYTRTSSRHSEHTQEHHHGTASTQFNTFSFILTRLLHRLTCSPNAEHTEEVSSDARCHFYRPQHPRELRAKTNRSFILSCSTRHNEKYDASLEKNVSIVLGCPYYSRWPMCKAWERNNCWL